MMKFAKRTVLSAALALAVLSPASAFASETLSVETPYLESEGVPVPAETIERDGRTWALVGTESVEDPSWQPQMAHFEREESVECWPEDLEATEGGMSASYPIDEQGAKGEIPRVSLTSEPVYTQRTYRAEQTVEISGLASNDMAQIEQERVFTMPESGNSVTLSFAGIEWTVEKTDEFGLPESYGASVLYRGTDTVSVLDRYVVTARYEGELAVGDDKGMVLIATYEPVVLLAPAEDEGQDVPLWPAVAAGVAAAAAVLAGGAVWLRTRNVRICERRAEKWVIVAATKGARTGDGTVAIELPARFDPARKHYALVLRGEIASGGEVSVSYLGKEILRTPTAEMIELSWQD